MSTRFGRRGSFVVISAVVSIALVAAVAVYAATPTWQGEALISSHSTGDGWEPAVAADPGSPYVYAAWMQYSGPSIYIYTRTSTDGGSCCSAAEPASPPG